MSEKPPKWKIIVNDVMFFSGDMMILGVLFLIGQWKNWKRQYKFLKSTPSLAIPEKRV
jgi:hypothetical protein